MKALRIPMLLLALAALPIVAQEDPCLPKKPSADQQDHLVWQFTDLLSADEVERLDRKLGRFAQETSNRIIVLVVDTLCGLPPSDFAFEIGETWGVGAKGFDNGIVLLVKPSGPPGQRHVFIATGYGLEGAIPDLTAKNIVENEILPRFRDGAYYSGLDHGTDVLMSLAKGEFDHKSYGKKKFPWPVMRHGAAGTHLRRHQPAQQSQALCADERRGSLHRVVAIEPGEPVASWKLGRL
ncbi:MAG: TPM domain-containing protein [Flavobacteriales bacterium]|nr:TPM domain-containing protein [Flavobacteriales bacterium]